MSGGALEYSRYDLLAMAEDVRIRIAEGRKGVGDRAYSEDFLQEMIDFYRKIQEFAILAHRMDWVLSGDDGEEDYYKCLSEDMKSEIGPYNPDEDDEWIKKSEFIR